MGIMSVSMKSEIWSRKTKTKVSVPYGDHVCLNDIAVATASGVLSFPSPMGIMSVSMQALAEHAWAWSVSVPYGDHVCLNMYT